MATDSLQRSGAGLWFSPCGRLSVRRLPTGQWAVSSVGAADRVGGFTAKVSRSIIEQRFASLADARDAMFIALELAEGEAEMPEVEWHEGVRATHQVAMSGGGSRELQIKLTFGDRLWRISAGPVSDASGEERSLLDSFMLQRLSYFLGRARTRAQAQRIVAQELSLPWPEIRA